MQLSLLRQVMKLHTLCCCVMRAEVLYSPVLAMSSRRAMLETRLLRLVGERFKLPTSN